MSCLSPILRPRLAPRALLCLVASALWGAAAAHAQYQYQTQLMALVDKTPIVLEAPYPFVEVSRILIDDFAQRSADSLGATPPNRLIAWYIPEQTLEDKIKEKIGRYRSLQVQVMKDMEPVRYTPDDLKKFQAQNTKGLVPIAEENAATVFQVLDMRQFEKKAGGLKILGYTQLGPDSFTMLFARSTEARDRLGGRAIEASVSCATYILLNEKILLLSVSGIELSANELGNTMRLSREWITLLRAANNADNASKPTPRPNP